MTSNNVPQSSDKTQKTERLDVNLTDLDNNDKENIDQHIILVQKVKAKGKKAHNISKNVDLN
ncbi:6027_t:CDS:2, partial [Cetraspora pellucida]